MEIVLKTKQSQVNKIKVNTPKPQTTTNVDKNQAPSSTNNVLTPEKQKVRVKQKWRKIFIGLIISLSALMFGYSLKEITSVPIATIMTEYSITSVDSFTAQAILIGILPIGAVLGAIITKFLIKRYRRLTGIYIFTIVNIIAVILINITFFTTLIIGRFIEGICIGYYSAIAPVYLKQIAPKQLRKMLGLFFSFGKVIGVLVVIAFELIFDAVGVPLGWRVILSMTAVFSILQAILIFFFGSDTPTEMIEKGNQEAAKNIIKKFYFEEYVDEVLNEYKQEYDMQMALGKETMSENLNHRGKKFSSPVGYQHNQIQVIRAETSPNIRKFHNHLIESGQVMITTEEINNTNQNIDGERNEEEMTYEQKKNYAYCLCLHLCVIRHFTGGNAIISQGGIFVGYFNTTLGTYTAIIINSIQFIFIVIGLVYIQKIIGKRPLFLFSITTLSILNIAVAIAMIFENVGAMQTLLCVYMVIYGGSFIAPIWAYPSEIVPASQSLMPNIFHWIALALSTLIPPLVMKIMPGNNPYPVFLFFGIYGFFSLIHVGRFLRQSDGLTYKEIIKSFV